MGKPNEELAIRIISRHYKTGIKKVERFGTGLCHYVYDVELDNGEKTVVRIADENSRKELLGGLYWHEKLKMFDLPVPKIYFSDSEGENPYVIMQRLPGKDLCFVYDELTDLQKAGLAEKISEIQNLMQKLPPAKGFGYALSYEDESLLQNSTWRDVVIGSLQWAQTKISDNGIFSSKYTDILYSRINRFRKYFEGIRPHPFLDDITDKNVIIAEGKLSGIVDIDSICFGDKLYHLALTRMALLARKCNMDYVNYLTDFYESAEEQFEVLDFYTAVFCVCFMAEVGSKFNKEEAVVDRDYVKLLEEIFEGLVKTDNVLKTDLMRYGESCGELVDEKIITDLIRVVKRGKEAVVLCCKAHPDMESEYMAVKLYFEKKYRNFKKEGIYHEGRIWDSRLVRAAQKKSGTGKVITRSVWVNNEFDVLEKLFECGANVPEPIACTDDAVVMCFIGKGEIAAPLLKDVRLERSEAESVFQKILSNIKIMLRNDVIHADLSPYNILFHEGEPVFIDFPQAVNPSMNSSAWFMFKRDIANVCKYFRQYGIDRDQERLARDLWEPYFGPPF